MIRPEDIPPEVVEAARYAFHNATGPTVADDWHVAIAAAINAWPEAQFSCLTVEVPGRKIILPLPQKEGSE
jgi:hypothetical protein